MKVYHSPKLRHFLEKKGGDLIVDLQYKKGWFWHTARNHSNIHIRIEPMPYYPSPKIIEYTGWGHLEIWNEGDIDLNKRLAELAKKYLDGCAALEKRSNNIDELMKTM